MQPEVAQQVKQIEDVIESLRAGFWVNGGDINFVRYENFVVYVNLIGSYVGCQSDLKSNLAFVEREIRLIVPDVERVDVV